MNHYMSHHFDTLIDRRNTGSVKFDFAEERGAPSDALPMWIADMDFPAPEPVLKALDGVVSHGIFGYTEVHEEGSYFDAVSGWFSARFGYRIEPQWLVKTPGVVYALAMGIRALTRPGDAVLIQQPVYYPFSQVIRDNGRRLINNELRCRDGLYTMDLEDFERKILEERVRLFLLCSPHNPVGRVWTREELVRLGEICRRHGVRIISDEIHCDFTYEGHPHTILPTLGKWFEENTILCTAPSKTFNLAGLQLANIIIPNDEIRTRFRHEIAASGYSQLGTMGLVSCEAAYAGGGEWLEALKRYLRENLDFLRDFLAERIPEITLVEPQGTYLVWVDCAGLGLEGDALNRFFAEEAKLWVDGGTMFGGDAARFQRLNIACPKATLTLALERLEGAVARRRAEGGS